MTKAEKQASSARAIRNACREALRIGFTLMSGMFFLGIGYGVYMRSCDFGILYPVCMAATIFAGSMEFITAGLLAGCFNPLYALLLTLVVNENLFPPGRAPAGHPALFPPLVIHRP